MPQPLKITIVGAGAIGGWLGVCLARAGHKVSVVARGDTLAALREGTWSLDMGGQTMTATVRAEESADALGIQNLVLITLKGPALERLAPRLGPLIGQETIVVPVMNGVPWWFTLVPGGELSPVRLVSIDQMGAIQAAIPLGNVIGSVVHASVASIGPGRVVHKAGNRLILGEPEGPQSQRLEGLCSVFQNAGFEIEPTENIRQAIWYKLWGNMTMNPISAITGATCDRILDDELLLDFVLRVMAEAQSIGQRIGCEISERGEDRCAVTRQLGAFKTSMLQDVEGERPLEIDPLLSAPREIARVLGIRTPNMNALTGLVRLFGRTRGIYPE